MLNHIEAISFLKMWKNDIYDLSVKKYNDVIEVLINRHYLLTIKM